MWAHIHRGTLMSVQLWYAFKTQARERWISCMCGKGFVLSQCRAAGTLWVYVFYVLSEWLILGDSVLCSSLDCNSAWPSSLLSHSSKYLHWKWHHCTVLHSQGAYPLHLWFCEAVEWASYYIEVDLIPPPQKKWYCALIDSLKKRKSENTVHSWNSTEITTYTHITTL